MSTFAWQPDQKPYVIEGDDDKIVIQDGYSQWLLGPGADFNLFQEIKDNNSDPDYNLISIIRDLNQPGSPIGVNSMAQSMGNDIRFINRKNMSKRARPFDFEQTDSNATPCRLVTPVPIRMASLPSTYYEGNIPAYSLPAGVDIDQMVVIGVMDDSLNVMNERFASVGTDGTLGCRFDYVWLQDAISPETSSVPHGLERTAKDVDAVRQANPTASEAQLLEILGVKEHGQASYQPEPLNLSTSHGTFVADVAGGYAPTNAAGHNMRMIGVKLPVLSSQDTSGATLIAATISGSKYIFDRAEHMSKAIGVALPVVLNFSYGFLGGPHNGRHIVERALATHAEAYREAVKSLDGGTHVPVEITLPAGNSHLSQTHAATDLSAAEDEQANLSVDLVVQPEDRTASFVEFWLPIGATHTSLEITTPDGTVETFKLAKLNKPFGQILAKTTHGQVNRDTIIARLKLDQPNGVPESGHCWRLLLALAPTRILDQPRPAAPHGIWRINLSAKLPVETKLESWIQRDVSVSGLGQRGRQAYFLDDQYFAQRFDPLTDFKIFDDGQSVVRRDGTLSGIATVETEDPNIGVNIVGSYYHGNKTATGYSSAGSESIPAPHTLAPTDSSRMLAGLLASGTYSSSINAFNGTSAAAPQMARLLAKAIATIKPDDRASYDRNTIIQAARDDEEILRPNADHPEYLTNQRMRDARVKFGRLAPQSDLKHNIQRGRYAS